MICVFLSLYFPIINFSASEILNPLGLQIAKDLHVSFKINLFFIKIKTYWQFLSKLIVNLMRECVISSFLSHHSKNLKQQMKVLQLSYSSVYMFLFK